MTLECLPDMDPDTGVECLHLLLAELIVPLPVQGLPDLPYFTSRELESHVLNLLSDLGTQTQRGHECQFYHFLSQTVQWLLNSLISLFIFSLPNFLGITFILQRHSF